jgi:Cd2+/Zn2+-exporting ATPase
MLARCDTAVFDKTGTLTVGKLSVCEVCPVGISEKLLLSIAGGVESKSTHPIARAITSVADDILTAQEYKEFAGLGAYAVIDGKEAYVGSLALLKKAGIEKVTDTDKTAVHIAYDGKYVGCIYLSDSIKPTSHSAVQKLKRYGITTVMLTGDKQSVAQTVAKDVGIDEVYAGLLPADKVRVTENLINNGRRVTFAGDGINDAPVLARADVGIAMGGIGSDAAIEASDIVIMDDDPEKLAFAISLSRFTRKIVKQNIAFVLVIKALTLILGAFGLTDMWMAVFADVGVAVIAILNAMRTRRKK